tara:strand:- start:2940 stop:3122 length:183 start_codon:yes stop_codon:yes gene_type:complete
MRNPYDPPKTDTRKYDRYLETINDRDETDWGGFFFVVVILFIILFHHVLMDFFIGIFKGL